jgi:hypothetical protein
MRPCIAFTLLHIFQACTTQTELFQDFEFQRCLGIPIVVGISTVDEKCPEITFVGI